MLATFFYFSSVAGTYKYIKIMQKAIDILEIEIDSMKDAIKIEKNEGIKSEYSERILSCKDAIKHLKKDRLELLNALTHITNIEQSKGVEGCTFGDTSFDSVSTAYGYNQCLEYLQEIAFNAIKKANE